MGRSRGGLTTKINTLVDAGGRSIALELTEGQAHDEHILLADRAYDSDALRHTLAELGAWANIRPMTGRTKHCLQRLGLPAAQCRRAFFSKMIHFRGVATRYDKRDHNFLASVKLAALRVWLRSYELVT